MQKWNILSSTTVLESPWTKVKLERIRLPNGKIINDYSVIELPSVVVILALTEDNNIVLVKQYRHAVKKILYELPAGSYNPQTEDAVSTAKRELLEESGFLAHDIIQLGTFHDYPSKLTHSVTIFLARDVTNTHEIHQDDTEKIDVLVVPFTRAIELIKNDGFCTSGSMLALLLAKPLLYGESFSTNL